MYSQASLETAWVFQATPHSSTSSIGSPLGHNEGTEPCNRRTPLSEKSFHLNASSNVFRDVVAPKYTSTTFCPLPPLRRTSSFQLSHLDFAFQSFTVSSGLPHTSPNIGAPLDTLPLTPDHEEPPTLIPCMNNEICVAALSHPNSPYVPWASPVRRDIIRPSSPWSMVSDYSRPLSRSGAQAPEPAEFWLPRTTRTLRKVSKSMHDIRCALKRSMSRLAKHVVPERHPARAAVAPEQCPDYSPPAAQILLHDRARSPSLDSACTNSLAVWLSSRKEALEWDVESHRFMTLEDYDRAGSWILSSPDAGSHLSSPSGHSFSDSLPDSR